MNLNILLRGQSNSIVLGTLTGATSVAADVQRLLGFDGVNDTVTLRFEWLDSNGRNTSVGGTALIGDWLTPTSAAGTSAWQVNTLEQGLLNYIDALPTGTKAEPTVVLWLHNEYDSDPAHQPLSTAAWVSAVRYDASLVRAALGSNAPYVFVEPIPYVSGTDSGAQAIRMGMEQLAADPGFNARLTAQNDDLVMNTELFGAGGHMNQADAALVASRAARSIAEDFAAYAKPGSALASGNVDDTGPIAVAAQHTAPGQVLVTVKFDNANAIAPLDADAATGIGWTAIAGTTAVDATRVTLGASNSLFVSFGADLPAGAVIHYGYGNAKLVGADGSVTGNAIYDDQGLPMRTPAQGLAISGNPADPPVGKSIVQDFDAEFYLLRYPDISIAGVDPYMHYLQYGASEGRNPNGYFDTAGYLSNYPDVAAAGGNPLEHYRLYGWREGRDPSAAFDTKLYLQTYRDVAATGIDPLAHYLIYGHAEGRVAFNDGIFG